MNIFIKDLLNVVTGQAAPDFNFVLSGLVVYLVLLWLAFCAWVFVDARRRYGNIWAALLISLVVFVLNFPALIFYLVVRPEDDNVRGGNDAGVEVPVVKFVDENGNLRMALNLEIIGQQNLNSDMTVSVAWDGSRQDIDVDRKKGKKEVVQNAEVTGSDKIQKLAKIFGRKKSDYIPTEEESANLVQ